jgi:hypothetical protein
MLLELAPSHHYSDPYAKLRAGVDPNVAVHLLAGPQRVGQRIFDALVQPANCVGVEFLIGDFQLGRQKKFGWQFLDREPDGVRCAGKTSVSDGLPRLPVSDGG